MSILRERIECPTDMAGCKFVQNVGQKKKTCIGTSFHSIILLKFYATCSLLFQNECEMVHFKSFVYDEN